ncbi:mitochondrial import inner membrane translocase subunit Tim54 [Lipomyces arxii]|uniref:mitochondrial import inner membrane translocase subunit Tim54 n=1 Tax=Lipomyces arxii TaxID=56418 RepID=UPI0034CFC954
MTSEVPPPPPHPPKQPPRNPALEAMGIPRLRLPGRNMSIFLGAVFGISGLIYYDRKRRRENRQKWKDRVSFLANEPLKPDELPRKVTVYLAPPPGDHLDITKEYFTQYVKPILTAAAIDWDVVEETRQGEIRYRVAEQIRKQRRGDTSSDNEMLDAVMQGLKRDPEGGVVCVGRGAYKEYLHGLNEGWLGPLDPPVAAAVPTITDAPATETTSILESTDKTVEAAVQAGQAADSGTVTETAPPGADGANDDDKKEEKKAPIPKPYILQSDYASAPTPPELAAISQLTPIVYIPHQHILGFRHTPIRTYRFFRRREIAEKCGRQTAAAALSQTRPFIPLIDLPMGDEEEAEWPGKWKQTALEKGSEWMQPLVVDERIAQRLRVYELQADERNATTSSQITEVIDAE